jgi:hypothetical protein
MAVIALTSALMPGEVIPSSLVTSMVGFAMQAAKVIDSTYWLVG